MASISDERGWTRGAGLQPRCAAGRRADRGGQGPRAAGSTQTAPRAPEVSPAPSLGVGVRSGPDTWATVRGTLGSRCLLDLKQSRALFSVTEALGAFCVAEPVAAKARGDPRNLTPRSWDLGAASANRRPWASTTRSEAARLHFESHSHLVSSPSQAKWGLLPPLRRRRGPVGPRPVPFLPEAGALFSGVSCRDGPGAEGSSPCPGGTHLDQVSKDQAGSQDLGGPAQHRTLGLAL